MGKQVLRGRTQTRRAFMRLAVICAAVSAGSAALAAEIYRNDFSTRTSAAALPGDRWMSYTYDPARTLYRNYASNEEVPKACWSNSGEYQDGWAKAYMDSSSMTYPPSFAVALLHHRMRRRGPRAMGPL